MPRQLPRRKRIGHLDTIEIEGTVGAPTVVMFHGYGADMMDLASLADRIQAPKGTTWIFPNGHISIPLGQGSEGRGWFPISISELEKTMAGGSGIDLSQLVPPGLKRARELAFELVRKLDVPMSKLVLGGFSQGAMLATDVALRLPEPPAGLALLSSTLVNAAEWTTLAAQRTGLPFFLSHGISDTVLSFEMAERLEALLKSAGLQGSLQKFSGGHEIPAEVLIQLGAFLRKVVA